MSFSASVAGKAKTARPVAQNGSPIGAAIAGECTTVNNIIEVNNTENFTTTSTDQNINQNLVVNLNQIFRLGQFIIIIDMIDCIYDRAQRPDQCCGRASIFKERE
jgi:hypothetical protein